MLSLNFPQYPLLLGALIWCLEQEMVNHSVGFWFMITLSNDSPIAYHIKLTLTSLEHFIIIYICRAMPCVICRVMSAAIP